MRAMILRNPFSVYILWLVILVLYTIVGIPILSMGHSGGEQKPLTLLFDLPFVAIYGFFAISILTTFLNFQWFKRYWYFNVFIFLFTSVIITIEVINNNDFLYDFGEEKSIIGGKELIEQTEFFINTNKIRSRKFYLENKPDSIWSIYDINGKLISREIYKNGILIKKEEYDDQK